MVLNGVSMREKTDSPKPNFSRLLEGLITRNCPQKTVCITRKCALCSKTKENQTSGQMRVIKTSAVNQLDMGGKDSFQI